MSKFDSAGENACHVLAPESLVDAIVRTIELRSFGRVHRLQVDWHDGRLVIYGRTATYHAKQLVQHAAQEVAGGAEIENRIEVVGR